MLDDELLAAFADTFYGYGNYEGPYWFIGMEEGGGGTCEEVQGRLDAWNTRGRHELEDLAAFHLAIGQTTFFKDPVTLQPTWKALIRILLSGSGVSYGPPELKAYQKGELGQWKKRTVLSELLPLPSPGAGKWKYASWSELPQLKGMTKAEYIEHYAPIRIAHIRKRIAVYKPKVVIFYGIGFKKYWEAIAGIPLEPDPKTGFVMTTAPGTIFAIVRHPAAFGVSSAYFESVGSELAQKLGVPLTPWATITSP